MAWVFPEAFEFWDREFVKKCPIMELAVRNYFCPPVFKDKLAKFNKRTALKWWFFCLFSCGPDGIRTRDLGLDRAAC